MTVLLSARELVVRRDSDDVVRAVDLDLHEGEVVALLGPNGGGKSTLVAALGGIVTPTSGSIERRGTVAAALQSPGLVRRSARANVELAQAWWGVPRGERRERATRALDALHASALSSRRATLLSGGEQRRVHLARAIALESDVLLLDEPFAGLDPVTRSGLLEDATSVIRSRPGATLVVAHDRVEAWALADRIVVLVDGRIAASGAPQSVLEKPPTAEVARFLGYDGELRRGGRLVLTRPSLVHVDPTGEPGIVSRAIPVEDGCRVRLDLVDGWVQLLLSGVAPAIGDTVRVRVVGGAEFALDQVPAARA